MAFTFDQKQVFGDLATKVAKNNALVGQLERLFISEEREQLTAALHDGLLSDECQKVVKDPWSGFVTYCKWVVIFWYILMLSPICRENRSKIPLKIDLAFKNQKQAQKAPLLATI